MITTGEWMMEPQEFGHSGSREEPPEPAIPASVFSLVQGEDSEDCIPICTMLDPVYMAEIDHDDIYDDGRCWIGSADDNARLIALAPKMAKLLIQICENRQYIARYGKLPELTHVEVYKLLPELKELTRGVQSLPCPDSKS